MEVSINFLAVLLAGLSAMVVGSIWYSPGVFGKKWAKLAKVDMTKDDPNFSGAKMALTYFLVFLGSLLTAYILAGVTFVSNAFFQNSFMHEALRAAFWLWLGFVATRFFMHDTFEGRRKKLTLLNVSHELVTLLVMGLIIGAMGY